LRLYSESNAEPSNLSTKNDADLRRNCYIFPSATCAACLLALAIFFRDFLDSGFNLIAGNLGDNRLCIAIIEHWRAVLYGQAFFTSPNFYWPQLGVLGYSEAFFLHALPYLVGRAAGLDPYLAFELTLILFKAVGFFSMLWLLRSFIGVSRSVALVGSALFTLSNLYFISVGHSQLVAVVFVPLLIGIGCTAWRMYSKEQTVSGCIYGALFGALLALILYTSYYIGWFTTLAGGIAILSACAYEVVRKRSFSSLNIWIRAAVERGSIFATAALAFEITVLPFVMTYLPALQQTGGRSFEECLLYSAQPIDVVNIGSLNWIWGGLLDTIRARSGYTPMIPSESQRGWPPLTLGLLAAGLLLGFLRAKGRNRPGSEKNKSHFLSPVLGATFIVGWALSIKVHEHSLWWLIFKFVPGGSAIRVPARFNFVLNILVVVVVCLVLDQLYRGKRHSMTISFWVVSAFLLLEQTNTVPTHHINRDSEHAIFGRVHRPPSACTSFFLASPATPERPPYADQIDAMLIARINNLPTVNGYSGWSPPGWNLAGLDRDYLAHVRRWVQSRGIAAGICGLDLRDGNWSPGIPASTAYLPGSEIDFHSGGNARQYETEGWGKAEDIGTWTLDKRSVLELPLRATPSTDLVLTLRAHPFMPPQRPAYKEILQVNERNVAEWTIAGPQSVTEEHVRLPLFAIRSHVIRIELLDSDPRSPAELKFSTDARKLGLLVESLKLEPVPASNARSKR
jgi:hypothetical protein